HRGKLAADRAGAITHDVHSHAPARRLRALEADAVVLDRHREAVGRGFRTNIDLRRLAVLDRVRDRLLRDAVKVVRALLAELIELRRRMDSAADAENGLRAVRELLEGMPQRAARLARHRAESPRELGRLRDRLIDQVDRLLEV